MSSEHAHTILYVLSVSMCFFYTSHHILGMFGVATRNISNHSKIVNELSQVCSKSEWSKFKYYKKIRKKTQKTAVCCQLFRSFAVILDAFSYTSSLQFCADFLGSFRNFFLSHL